jgi:class 3 adenylate cyclase
MAKNVWKKVVAEKRIATRLNEVSAIEIKEYVRDTDLHSLQRAKAYRVDGVHLYVDILNLGEMLQSTDVEGVTCQKRTLRFLNLHQRAVHRILGAVDAIKVDFHNQRLHAVIAKPYGDEKGRVHRAIAIGQLIIDVLSGTGEDGDEHIPAADIRIGIDSGKALAVRNGRRGSTEPLFLGEPANHAAKRAGGGTATGIFLTNKARAVISLDEVDDQDATALESGEVETSQDEADLPITASVVLRDWRKDLEANPIGAFSFSGHTPPYANLDLELLSPAIRGVMTRFQSTLTSMGSPPMSRGTLMTMTQPRTSCAFSMSCVAKWMRCLPKILAVGRSASSATVFTVCSSKAQRRRPIRRPRPALRSCVLAACAAASAQRSNVSKTKILMWPVSVWRSASMLVRPRSPASE